MRDRHPDSPVAEFGLYFHVPLCQAKCEYCDFVSWPVEALGPGKRGRIVRALEREIDLAVARHKVLRGRPLDTIYFGGGTPSLLQPAEVERLVRRALKVFEPRGFERSSWDDPSERGSDAQAADARTAGDSARTVEITLECNPTSARGPRIEEYARAGVNRISLGVQSFDAGVLRALGRTHSPDEARHAIHSIHAGGFPTWGLDLIFGAPGSSVESWGRDLDEAVAHGPPHISVYGLTLHKGTRLHERHARGEIDLPDEETQREMFLAARRRLCDAGWHHYEISNYARPGHHSRHNSLYWNGGEYLGIGVGAHSHLAGRRYANPEGLDEYLEATEGARHPGVEEPAPSLRSRRAERIMLALRQCDGADPHRLSRDLGCDFVSEYARETGRLSESGLLSVSTHNLRLTEEGLLLSDTVFEEFF
ncbi:coproporphyrinogen III oxidase family protein [Candidatus Sumerlaeota bacterium]|nr:coproporphyrinogen III oxidase family protein [Candidatus Sumerlaeota bacterium]